MPKLLRTSLILVFFWVLTALVWQEALLYSQNNLYSHPEWISYKSTTDYSPTARLESVMTRALLGGNRFSPTEYFGWQRIFSRRSVALKQYSATLRLLDTGSVDLLFNVDEHSMEGLRLSRNPYFKNLHYKSTMDGEFVSKMELPTLSLDKGTHVLTLTEKAEGLEVLVDQRLLAILPTKFTLGRFGFLTSMTDVFIEDLHITSVEGLQEFRDFKNRNYPPWLFLKNLAAITVVVFFTGFALSLADRGRSVLNRTLKVSQALFLFSAFWYAFDFYYYSKITPLFAAHPFEFSSPQGRDRLWDFERTRFHFFESWYAAVGGDAPNLQKLFQRGVSKFNHAYNYCSGDTCLHSKDLADFTFSEKTKQTKRVAYVGGSFLSGDGGESWEKTLVARAHQVMQKQLLEKRLHLESLNLSKSNFFLPESLVEIKSELDRYQPDLLVFCYGIQNLQEKAIEELFEFVAAKGIEILIMVPPMSTEQKNLFTVKAANSLHKDLSSTETKDEFFYPIKSLVTKLRRTYHAHVFNPNPLLNDLPTLSGLVWWDPSHPTPYGIGLLVKDFSLEIETVLDKKP